MSMKEAFDIYFEKMYRLRLKKRGTPPCHSVIKGLENSGLYNLETMEKHNIAGNKGYADWKPVLQNDHVNFEPIERELGITIHPQIKSFLSTYWFLSLNGDIKDVSVYPTRITPDINFDEYIRYRFNNDDYHYLKDSHYIYIGFCEINGNNDYLLEVDNNTGKVFAVEVMDKKTIKLADSIEELLVNMEGY